MTSQTSLSSHNSVPYLHRCEGTASGVRRYPCERLSSAGLRAAASHKCAPECAPRQLVLPCPAEPAIYARQTDGSDGRT